MDRFLDYALWLTARDLQAEWLPAVAAGGFDFGGNPRHLIFALQAVNTPAVVAPLLATLRAGRVPAGQEEGVLTTIATQGKPDDLAVVFDLALTPETGPAGSASGLARGPDEGDRAAEGPARGRPGSACECARTVPDEAPSHDGGARGRTLEGGAAAQVARGARRVGRDRARAPPGGDRRPGAGSAIGRAARRSSAWPGRTPPPRPSRGRSLRLPRSILGPGPAARRRGWESRRTRRVMKPRSRRSWRGWPRSRRVRRPWSAALAGKTLPKDVAKVAIRASRSTGREYPTLVEALGRSASLQEAAGSAHARADGCAGRPGTSRGRPCAGRGGLSPQGDPLPEVPRHRGGRRAGRAEPRERRRQHRPITWSTRCSSPTRRSRKATTRSPSALNDGRVVTGIKLRQTDTALVLRDADDREVALPLSAIEEQKPAGSLMPVGLVETMTEGELLDLVRFLSELGKIGPYAVSKAQLMRALAGARDERRGRHRAAADEPGCGDHRSPAWSGAPRTVRWRGSCPWTRSRCHPASRTGSSTCRPWVSPAARSTSRPAGRSTCLWAA